MRLHDGSPFRGVRVSEAGGLHSGPGPRGVLPLPGLLGEPQPWCHQGLGPLALPPRAAGRSRASIRIGSGYTPFPAQAGPCRKEEGAEGGGRCVTLPSACPVAVADRGEGCPWPAWGAWGARGARGVLAGSLIAYGPKVALESPVGPSGRAEGGGHPSDGPSPSPHHLPQPPWGTWPDPRGETDPPPSLPGLKGHRHSLLPAWHRRLSGAVPPCTAGSPPAAWG